MTVGPGLIYGPSDSLHVVAAVLAIIALIGLLSGLLLTRRRVSRLLTLGASGLTIAVAVLLVALPAPVYGPVSGGGTGTKWVEAPSGGYLPESVLIMAAAGDPYRLVISVENDGPLPIRVLGLVVPTEAPTAFPSWESLSVTTNAMPPMAGVYEGASPGDIEIPPGEMLVLNADGRATRCAAGLETSSASASVDHVWIAYSILGLASTAELVLPNDLVEPQQQDCATF